MGSFSEKVDTELRKQVISTAGMLLLVVVALLLIEYHGLGWGDHAIYLPYSIHWSSPDLLQNDWFASATPSPNPYFSFFASIGYRLGIPALWLFLFFIVQVALCAFAFERLGRTFRLNIFSLIVVLLIVLYGFRGYGRGATGYFESYLIPHGFALGLGAISMALLLEKRMKAALLIVGITGLIHAADGLMLGAIIITTALTDRLIASRGSVKSITAFCKTCWLFLLIAAAGVFLGVLPHLIAEAKSSVTQSSEIIRTIYTFRQPHEHDLSKIMNSRDMLFLAALFVLSGLTLLSQKSALMKKSDRDHTKPSLLISLFLFMVVAILLTSPVYITKGLFLLKPLRLSPLVVVFCLMVITSGIQRALEYTGKKGSASITFIISGALCSMMLGYILWNTGALQSIPSLILIMLVAGALCQRVDLFSGKVRKALTVLSVILFINILLLAYHPRPFHLYATQYSGEYRALCDWVKNHTPSDAVFLTPPSFHGFSTFSHRAEVVSFKKLRDIRDDTRAEWIYRLNALTGTNVLERNGEGHFLTVGALDSLYESRVINSINVLSQRYSARFAVVRAARDNALPSTLLERWQPAYRTNLYLVLEQKIDP